MTEHRFNDVFSSLPTTIFEQMSQLAAKHGSINLGQGFPDSELEGPASMKDEVTRSMREESNQYPPMMGIPELRQAIVDSSFNRAKLTANNVLVTLGASEALASSFLGLLNQGDEVIVFAPMYDSYIPMIRRAGATPVTVHLSPPNWNFNVEALKASFTLKTKLIVINTPHNPTGKVFTTAELSTIAECMKLYPSVLAVLDEVYEHHVFPALGKSHNTLAQFPQLEDRCIRIGSAGKTFSFTDFKVGWAVSANLLLLQAVAKAHQFLTFTVNSALQRAVAWGLQQEQSFYLGLGEMMRQKRQLVEQRLTKMGFIVLPADGTYFLIADFAPLLPLLVWGPTALRTVPEEQRNYSEYDDVQFCTQMTINPGVTLIPVSAFYEKREVAPKTLVRFVLSKTDEKLTLACDKLESFFNAEES
jgi:aspartate/methionine/tyrosine aminotransferase